MFTNNALLKFTWAFVNFIDVRNDTLKLQKLYYLYRIRTEPQFLTVKEPLLLMGPRMMLDKSD